ncbi:uncharacterized protein LOC112203645 [Rosa chinensis]|uniref:uncharacterized protein LOC112203645 n=1 Tax=Rosa chinensis TaxID=74649 RepID=UPI000D0909EB|nr:uncharacterized protein LOC112203645 [Rosa chinensis]
MWNESLIRSTFRPHEVDTILSIPIAAGRRDDSIVWHYCKDGRYTVKSGCWLASELQRVHEGSVGCSNSSNKEGTQVWDTLWKLRIANKVKLFLWRACKGFLPCAANLFRRYREILTFVADVGGRRRQQSIVCGAVRGLRRNRFKHEGVVEESKHIVWSANEWLNNFQTVTKDATQKRVKVKWRPPTAPNLKLNTDAAIDYKKKKAGLGMVVRDGEGKLKCAGHKVLPGNPSIVAIEALAVYHGLLLCREAGFQNLVVESDSTIVIDALNKTKLDLSVEGGVLDDIKCLASTLNQSCGRESIEKAILLHTRWQSMP